MSPSNEAAGRNSLSRQPTADQQITVYDGQHRVGSIVERNGEFLALDSHDRRVGVFTKQSDAVRALPAARSCVDIKRSCVGRRAVETT
jgi:hypothetical protein